MFLTERTEFTERKQKEQSVGFIFFRHRKKIKPTFSVLSVVSSEPCERVRKNPGFTLLELLVVISIIAILAGMVIPTFYYAKKRAREAKARVAVKQLETAFKAYLDTYKVWPAGFADGDIKDDMFKVMRGENISDMNKNGIAFYEFESTTNYSATYEFYALDPWSAPGSTSGEFEPKAYRVMFDKDYDNRIDALPDIYRSVVVYSVGTNRVDDSGGGDDVASWK